MRNLKRHLPRDTEINIRHEYELINEPKKKNRSISELKENMLKYSEKQTERNNDITGLFIEKIKARKQLTPNRINPNNTINN